MQSVWNAGYRFHEGLWSWRVKGVEMWGVNAIRKGVLDCWKEWGNQGENGQKRIMSVLEVLCGVWLLCESLIEANPQRSRIVPKGVGKKAVKISVQIVFAPFQDRKEKSTRRKPPRCPVVSIFLVTLRHQFKRVVTLLRRCRSTTSVIWRPAFLFIRLS